MQFDWPRRAKWLPPLDHDCDKLRCLDDLSGSTFVAPEPMDESSVASVERLEQSDFPNIISIPAGTFPMGSDKHYTEEAPFHRVTVDRF